MPVFDSILPHAPVFALVLARLSGLFLLAPLLSSVMLPRRVAALLILVMALAVYPTIDHARVLHLRLDVLDLLPVIAAELLVGAGIGLLALLPLACVQLGGLLMGQQMGLGIAGVLNPAVDIESDNVGQILFYLALAAFIGMGGIEAMFACLMHTFAGMPPGGMLLTQAPLEPVLVLLASGFELALRIALPVLAIIMLESVAVGFLTRTVPSLNIMSFGFPVRILIGLLVLIAGLPLISEIVQTDLDGMFESMRDWTVTLGL